MNVIDCKYYLERVKGNKTLVNGVFFSIFAFVGRGIGFVLLIILASYIPPSDYGKLSLFNTAIMLLGIFLTFSTSGYFGISYFKEDKKVFHQDFTFIMLMLIVTGAIAGIVLTLYGEELSVLAGISENLLWWALLIAFVTVPYQLHMDYYRLQEKVKLYGIMNLGNAILNAIFSLLLVITFSQGWMGRVNTQIYVTVLFGVIAIFFFLKKGFFDFNIRKDRMKLILFWGLPQIPHLATNWIRQGCDQYIINYNYSTQEVGLFSFALNMVSIITMIGMAFNSSNSVTIYQVLSDKSILDKKAILKKNTYSIFAIYLSATLLTILFGVVFVPLLLSRYSECIPYFLLLSIYGFMVCMYFLFCNYLFYYGYTKNLMFITFGTSVLHLCLSVMFTPYSLFLTAFIYIISQSLCVGLVFFYSRIILRKELIVE